jgi:pyruvate-formate lyase-activating enzyme
MDLTDRKNRSGPEVLLVNPWIYDFAAYDLWAKPLGLLYIASVLRATGYRVRLLDCLDRRHPSLPSAAVRRSTETAAFGGGKFHKEVVPKPPVYKNILRRYGRYGIAEAAFLKELAGMSAPSVVLVTSGMTYWYPGVFRAIQLLHSRFSETPIFLGGIYATLCPDHARRHSGADQVLTGEGERAVLMAVDDICGHRSDAGSYDHPNTLPLPAFDLYTRLDYACVLTSRGCPYRCTYCASHLLSNGYQRRPVEDVLVELTWLRRGLGVKNIAFYDDALLVESAEHIKPILEETIRRDLDCWFHTPNGLHARKVDRELAELMFRSGFKTVRLGLETADEVRQERTGQKATREDLARAMENLEWAGYLRGEIGVYLLAGLPEQSYQEVHRSVDFVASLGAQTRLALYSPIPGTIEWLRAVQAGCQDPLADPLLHNNTTFTASSSRIPAEKFEALKQYVKSRNMTLS